MWSALSGAVGGAIGSCVAAGAGVALRVPAASHPHPAWTLLVVVAVVLGAAFGRVTRRLTRVLPRILFGAIAAVTLCLGFYAFVLARVAPGAAASIPFGTSALGALLYGACIGAMPLLRTRSERGRKL
jgi:tellurite resistance protein TehA-like permease